MPCTLRGPVLRLKAEYGLRAGAGTQIAGESARDQCGPVDMPGATSVSVRRPVGRDRNEVPEPMRSPSEHSSKIADEVALIRISECLSDLGTGTSRLLHQLDRIPDANETSVSSKANASEAFEKEAETPR